MKDEDTRATANRTARHLAVDDDNRLLYFHFSRSAFAATWFDPAPEATVPNPAREGFWDRPGEASLSPALGEKS
ncbi:MAG: hypothetical protein ABJP87_21015 [Bauldia litoralis]|uniref:hypothetical protein n=1 Tax=Bauldia litoralis TaxID=665467 RepID=UPI003297997D